MVKNILAALCILSLSACGMADWAEENVTLVCKDGARLEGTVLRYDIDGRGSYEVKYEHNGGMVTVAYPVNDCWVETAEDVKRNSTRETQSSSVRTGG